MTNILSFDASLEALESECKAQDFYYLYSDDHRVWSRGFERNKRIHAILNKLSHSRNAIEIFNRYAPEEHRMPLESKYY
jgi:hypothetical protein